MFEQKPKATQQTTPAKSSIPVRGQFEQSRELNSILNLQRTIGNQAVQRLLRTHAGELNTKATGTASPRLGYEFGRIAKQPRAEGALQAKLAVNEPGDQYEQEADRISEQVMRMQAPESARTAPPTIQRLGAGFQEELAAKRLQRLCNECGDEALQRKTTPAGVGADSDQAHPQAEAKVNAVSGGQPLSKDEKAFFESRFGADFSRVRIHAGGSADTAARAVGALAFARGSDIVFREDQYRPDTFAGRQLLAHELTHVVQQGAAPSIQNKSSNESGETHIQSSDVRMGVAGPVLQRQFPGDGMLPPGDCGWAQYLVLRGSVETAKAVVSTLGACSPGDSCLFLATKIAAITAEIAARVALDATCFKGGDTGHRQQVQDKVNMMNRCYRFFQASNCSPELIAAMAVVVEKAREVIAAAAIVVAIAVVAALIAAIIALVEAIAAAVAAAAAAAAEAAAIAAAVASLGALLLLILEQMSPSSPTSA